MGTGGRPCLKERDDSSVFVLSPDLVEADYREAAASQRFHVASVPHIPMPGRAEYKMAAPLQMRQRAVLETFAPHVVHVAAPDMLGHSAVRWAAESGVCSVCSYHTAYDTYLQFYRVGKAPLRGYHHPPWGHSIIWSTCKSPHSCSTS